MASGPDRDWRIGSAAALWLGLLVFPHSALDAQQTTQAPAVGPQPEVVRPGDGTIDGRRIPAYATGWRHWRRAPDGTDRTMGHWADTVSFPDGPGRPLIRRVQHIHQVDGTHAILTNSAHAETLLPRTATAGLFGVDPFLSLSFSGSRVEGRRLVLPANASGGGPVPARMVLDLDQPVFDWRWWGLLVAALPLCEGYEARFLAYAAEGSVESPLIWISARVEGSEVVTLESGRTADAWRVRVDAGDPWTVWVARDRGPPPVVRIRIAQPDGSELWWEGDAMTPTPLR